METKGNKLQVPREYWRHRFAGNVLPQCVQIVADVLVKGGKLTRNNAAEQAAEMAVTYADTLLKELEGRKKNEGKDN